jgi:hypothetical protein
MLPVPFASQITPGALEHNNDCGAASAKMSVNAYKVGLDKSVDQFYNMIIPAGDMPLHIDGLQRVLTSYGVKNVWKAGQAVHDMYDILVMRCPIIALIHYAPLVDAGLTEKKLFKGAHFVVVIGMDIENIYIHDPYSQIMGIQLPVPVAIFNQAWSQCYLDGNPTNGSINMTIAIQDLSTPITPPGTAKYIMATVNGVAIKGINVRSGPGENYQFVKTLWRTTTPFVFITKVVGIWGLLEDGSGWVYMPYLTKI